MLCFQQLNIWCLLIFCDSLFIDKRCTTKFKSIHFDFELEDAFQLHLKA